MIRNQRRSLQKQRKRQGTTPTFISSPFLRQRYEINALQRASTVIVQKSLREGFGLTVTEALCGRRSRLLHPAQVGFRCKSNINTAVFCHNVSGAAFAIKQLLNSPEYAKRLGENGREHVRQNFLLTRHLKDYMLLFLCNVPS